MTRMKPKKTVVGPCRNCGKDRDVRYRCPHCGAQSPKKLRRA